MNNLFTWSIFRKNGVFITGRLNAGKILEKSFQHGDTFKLLPPYSKLPSYVSKKRDFYAFSGLQTRNNNIEVTNLSLGR